MMEETDTTARHRGGSPPPGRRGTRYDSRVEVVDSTLLYITDSPDVWGNRRLQIP